MLKKIVEYLSLEERQQALIENNHLILIEERNITEGNFLIFVDVLAPEKPPTTIELVSDKVDLLIQMQLEREGIL